jgi:hypothetical protein
MTDEIAIPAWCKVPKPYFKTRPDQSVIQQIKDFIKASGQPHMWPGHTHTKPEKGSRIDYLDEYDLPKSHHKDEARWAPCPCCSPTRPKYFKGGKIGWFPDEGIIRNMGPDCFAAFDKEGHLQAVAKLRKEQQTSKDIAYLLANYSKAPGAIRVMERALPCVLAVDALRKVLRHELPTTLKGDLWSYIKDGNLKIAKQKKEGTTEEKQKSRVFVNYASIDGYRMLDPNEAAALAVSLKYVIDALKAVEPGHDFKATIAGMSEDERKKTARILGRSLNRAKDVFKEVADIRQFVSVVTIATLRNWGLQNGCPIRIHTMLDGLNLYVGRNEHEHRRFEIPPEFFHVIGELPNIGDFELAA